MRRLSPSPRLQGEGGGEWRVVEASKAFVFIPRRDNLATGGLSRRQDGAIRRRGARPTGESTPIALGYCVLAIEKVLPLRPDRTSGAAGHSVIEGESLPSRFLLRTLPRARTALEDAMRHSRQAETVRCPNSGK